MPGRWEVTLTGLDAATVRLEHLHAVVSSWFDDGDHGHRAAVKAYSVTPARVADGGTSIEIGLLDDALAERIVTKAAEGVLVRFGSTWTRVARSPRQVAAVSWLSLADATAASTWCLRFITPTTFRRGNAFTPSPSLRAILGSLRRSWHSFAPADIPPLVLDLAADPVWLTDIDVASHVTRVNERTVSGFAGRLRFTCDAGAEVAGAVDRLVRLAPYAGVGAHTTRGFGVTRPEPTWPTANRATPRTRRTAPTPVAAS